MNLLWLFTLAVALMIALLFGTVTALLKSNGREDIRKPPRGWICLECHGIGAVYDDDTGLPMACPSCKGVRQ